MALKDTQLPPPPSSEQYRHTRYCIQAGSDLYHFFLQLTLWVGVLAAMCWRWFPLRHWQLRTLSIPHASDGILRTQSLRGSWCSSASIFARRFWDSSLVAPGSLDSIPILWKARIAFWLLSFHKQEGGRSLERPILWERVPGPEYHDITLARLMSIFINRSNVVPASSP